MCDLTKTAKIWLLQQNKLIDKRFKLPDCCRRIEGGFWLSSLPNVKLSGTSEPVEVDIVPACLIGYLGNSDYREYEAAIERLDRDLDGAPPLRKAKLNRWLKAVMPLPSQQGAQPKQQGAARGQRQQGAARGQRQQGAARRRRQQGAAWRRRQQSPEQRIASLNLDMARLEQEYAKPGTYLTKKDFEANRRLIEERISDIRMRGY